MKAKTEIFDSMDENGRVCINGDDDMLATIKEIKGRKPVRFGMNRENDLYADQVISHGLFGSTCDIHMEDKLIHTNVPLPGGHMILNALAATAVGRLLGLTGDEIKAGIEAVKPTDGRSNILRKDGLTIIDDCYNANPVSMKAAIDLLTMADTRKVAILGDMGELGDTELMLHKEVGKYAASSDLNVLVCVGKLSLHMYEGASETFKGNLHYYETRDALIEALPSIIKENDTVLVKASHFMAFDHIVKALMQ
jgi:UDP-N-acetylmuramoyl-tripeptide--D-alanyl-D-alanine ligase